MSEHSKPEITKEARARISACIKEIQASQKKHCVTLRVSANSVIAEVVDNKRGPFLDSDGQEYGDVSAFVDGEIKPSNLQFEDFSGWGQ